MDWYVIDLSLFLIPSSFSVYLTVAREPYDDVMHKALYIHSIRKKKVKLSL
jgi:hypothetical protein